jgi:hypothetical protein
MRIKRKKIAMKKYLIYCGKLITSFFAIIIFIKKANVAIDNRIVEIGIRQPTGFCISNNWLKFTFSAKSKTTRNIIVKTVSNTGFLK